MKFDSPTLKFSISGLRGVYPADISPEKWIEYVRAYASVLPPGAIAIARDARNTGPGLVQIAAGTLTLLGRDVHDLGLVPTPTIKAYVAAKKLAGGLMVSASHNPAEYNALKFIKSGGMFFDAGDNRLFSAALDSPTQWCDYRKQGRSFDRHAEAIALHIASILKVVRKPKRRLKVVVDSVGSCGGEIAVLLLKKLGVLAEFIFLKEVGEFPRPPEPVAAALGKLAAAVKKYKADVGFAFDPDADRLSLVDEKGRAIGEEYTLPLAILAGAKSGGIIVANLSTSMLTEAAATMRKCKFIRSEVGEANVVAEMLRRKSVFGGEGNGGVIDARIPSFGRDGLAGMAHVLSLLGAEKKTLSAWVSELPEYYMAKEVRRDVSEASLRAAEGKAAAFIEHAKIDRRDGFHVSGFIPGSSGRAPAWIHLRSSNTEPVIRILAEANSKKNLQAVLKAIDL
jgi:phosphomannomutase